MSAGPALHYRNSDRRLRTVSFGGRVSRKTAAQSPIKTLFRLIGVGNVIRFSPPGLQVRPSQTFDADRSVIDQYFVRVSHNFDIVVQRISESGDLVLLDEVK